MITFGLVGCGRVAKNHLQAFSDHAEHARLVAVCDILPDRAQKVAAETGADAYTDLDTMLTRKDLDAVVICTPSGLHPEHGVKVARSGRHVLSEKPIGITLEAVDDLIRVCEEKRVHLFVVKQNRLNATMLAVKRAIDKGRFGRLHLIQSNVFWTRPQAYYDSAPWRGTWALEGGAFMNQASHYVDMLYWLAGDAESVLAATATLGRNIETEDTGAAIIRFQNGTLGSINVTMLAYPRNFEGSVTLLGERGTVRIGGVAVNKVEKWEFADYDDDDKDIFTASYPATSVYGSGHSAYLKNVLDVIEGRGKPGTDGRSGRKSVEMILAIQRSAREGRLIQLPLLPAETE